MQAYRSRTGPRLETPDERVSTFETGSGATNGASTSVVRSRSEKSTTATTRVSSSLTSISSAKLDSRPTEHGADARLQERRLQRGARSAVNHRRAAGR